MSYIYNSEKNVRIFFSDLLEEVDECFDGNDKDWIKKANSLYLITTNIKDSLKKKHRKYVNDFFYEFIGDIGTIENFRNEINIYIENLEKIIMKSIDKESYNYKDMCEREKYVLSL